MPQTPLVDKMFSLQMDSGKKFKRKGKLQFTEEEDAINLAFQRDAEEQKKLQTQS